MIAGHDFYPISVHSVDGSTPSWTIAERIAFGMQTLREWHQRYQQPFWIGETSNLSLPITDQIAWLTTLAAGLDELTGAGLPVRGLCWYSRGDQFDWQTGLVSPTGAVTEVGLFDTRRHPRPAAAAFRELATRSR